MITVKDFLVMHWHWRDFHNTAAEINLKQLICAQLLTQNPSLELFSDSPSFSNNYFVFKLSSPQPWDGGSLLTAGFEAGALIQCLLNSTGFSQCQKVLDQGWTFWKTLARYGVWSWEIKKRERGRRRQRKAFPWRFFLISYNTSNCTGFFRLYYWVLWEKKRKSAMSHRRAGE